MSDHCENCARLEHDLILRGHAEPTDVFEIECPHRYTLWAVRGHVDTAMFARVLARLGYAKSAGDFRAIHTWIHRWPGQWAEQFQVANRPCARGAGRYTVAALSEADLADWTVEAAHTAAQEDTP